MPTLKPKESSDYIASLSKNVSINGNKIPAIAEQLYGALERQEMRIISPAEHPTFPPLTDNDALNCIFFLDALNFCFWTNPGEKKWTVPFKGGKSYTGYFALCAAVGNAASKNIQIYEPSEYVNYTLDDVKQLFKGNDDIDIPLLEKRLECLHEVGNVLLQNYRGQFINVLLSANGSATKLLDIITNEFPCFNDTAIYCDQKVSLQKRAQILVADVWGFYNGQGLCDFKDIDKITMFADYRIPQVLVHFGILSYSDELMNRLKQNEILKNGCAEEVEIRGCSIKAVELLNLAVHDYMSNRKHFTCNDIIIDNYLWGYRREHAEELEVIPFHKVLSIYY